MARFSLPPHLRRRTMVLVAMVVAVVLGMVVAQETAFAHDLARMADTFQIVGLLVALAGGVVGLVQSYLQYGAKEATDAAAEQVREQMSALRPSASSSSDIAALHSALNALQQRVDASTGQLSKEHQDLLAQAMADKLTGDAVAGKIQDVAKRLDQVFNTERALEQLERNSVVSLARLNGAIPEMTRRANLNLAIGIATTLIGVSILAVTVFSLPPPQQQIDPLVYLLHFVPRVSLVILIEVFAYFFLRLYKDNLASVGVLRDEMTRVEVARTALASATISGDKEAMARIGQLMLSSRSVADSRVGATEPLDAKKIKELAELAEKLASLAQSKAG